MHLAFLKQAFTFLLILSIGYAQVGQGLAWSKTDRVKVAFVGIKFNGLKPHMEKAALDQILAVITSERSFQVITPEEICAEIGMDQASEALNRQTDSTFFVLAERLQVDYTFAGELENNSRDSSRILLDGVIRTFDRSRKEVLQFRVLTYLEDLAVELRKFKTGPLHAITVLDPVEEKRLKIWPLALMGTLTVAGILAFNTFGKSGGRDRETPDPPTK